MKSKVNPSVDLAASLSREWLETNGLGGFSSSTIIGLNTRRYHGLLSAATKPPVGRVVMLSKLEEVLIVAGRRYELSANQYPGVIHPQGFKFQTGFRLDPFPVFTYEVAGLRLEKSVFMVQGHNTTVVHYELKTGALRHGRVTAPAETPQAESIKLEIRPLIAFRDYHSTTHENDALNPHVKVAAGTATVAPYNDLPSLHFTHDVADIETDGFWYRNFEYAVERERGLDYVRGTRYNIHTDDDGLLYSGEPGIQLTWMDAKVGDWVVTPRQGKPVEIQALWYNALRVMEHLACKFNDASAEENYATMADRARASFNRLFWNEDAGCLYDVVDGATRDGAIRPNQVLAVSLTNSMLSKERAERILQVVERELLTPHGLRTLSPRDPNYVARYEGDPRQRDGAYHQGTVWPWLMGPFITAYVKTLGQKAGRRFAAEWLENFEAHLSEACLGQVSEIFDGDAPHTPRGCVAQAWSVAELLRAAVQDVYIPKPSTRAAKAI